MSVNKEIKDAVDSIKFSFKLKQAEIAEKLGVKSTYLSDMINGRVPFSDSMKEKIHEVFSYNFNDSLQKVPQNVLSNESKNTFSEILEELRQSYLVKEERLLALIESQQRTIEALSKKLPTAATA